jgi:hypothetical protein
MGDAAITYFPVGNGDTSLIRLSDKTSIIIDCNIRNDSRDENDDSCYDIHTHLLEELQRDSQDRPFTDAFVLSHADQDHSRGFETTFHTGLPSSYKKKDGEAEKIIISELWFSRRIFSNYEEPLCPDAEVFRKEALRRINLYKAKDSARFQSGNRIRIIGYGESDETKGLNEITTAPGNYINIINGSAKNDFAFFVHAPFKHHIDSKWSTRNNTSIILQAVFNVNGQGRAGLALFGGDACWEIWAAVLRRSSMETIEWDLLLSPHHCSWSFFNEVPYEDHKEPQESSLRILDHHRGGAFVIASSKPIKDDDKNPPHYAAKQEYIQAVGENNFFCTGEEPSEKAPEPLVFRMTENGPQKDESPIPSRVRSASAVSSTLRSPRTYGRR